jgi:uncharacterized protein
MEVETEIDRLTDVEELGELYNAPGEMVRRKVIDRLDPHARRFIELSPFCCIGTADAEGRQDVSPRGDVPGFVIVLDEHRLFLPDRPGNNRIDSMKNLLEHPRIGMLFIVPGLFDALRVNGSAEIGSPPELLEQSAVDGKVPKSGLLVHAEEVFFHCGRAVKRGRLWEAETQLERSAIPPIAAMIRDQIGADTELGRKIDPDAPETYMERLY